MNKVSNYGIVSRRGDVEGAVGTVMKGVTYGVGVMRRVLGDEGVLLGRSWYFFSRGMGIGVVSFVVGVGCVKYFGRKVDQANSRADINFVYDRYKGLFMNIIGFCILSGAVGLGLLGLSSFFFLCWRLRMFLG